MNGVKALAGAAAWMIAALTGAMIPMAAAGPPATPAHGEPFILSSAAFADGAVLPFKYTGNFHECHGGNISPPLQWRHAPHAARSFAITLFDYDGAGSLGIVHWVVYGIPADVTSLEENAGALPGAGFTGGPNMQQSLRYAGPCPRPGDYFHHYIFTVYALDVAPQALEAGLDRPALLAAMKGHIIVSASAVARFRRK